MLRGNVARHHGMASMADAELEAMSAADLRRLQHGPDAGAAGAPGAASDAPPGSDPAEREAPVDETPVAELPGAAIRVADQRELNTMQRGAP